MKPTLSRGLLVWAVSAFVLAAVSLALCVLVMVFPEKTLVPLRAAICAVEEQHREPKAVAEVSPTPECGRGSSQ